MDQEAENMLSEFAATSHCCRHLIDSAVHEHGRLEPPRPNGAANGRKEESGVRDW